MPIIAQAADSASASDDLVLVARRAAGIRRAANFIADNPQLAPLLKHSGNKMLISVITRAKVEAMIAAAREAGLEMTEWSDGYNGGVDIECGGGFVLRVYTSIAALGDAPPPRPTYRPLLGDDTTTGGES